MKFDFIIGNPPYQETRDTTKDMPVYNAFMDSVFDISDKVLLITPGRFLFNAGATPKAWNQKMLNDEHFKVCYYEPDSSKIFAGTDIKGGVAITYRSKHESFGAIGMFTSYSELNSIRSKVEKAGYKSISSIIYSPAAFKFSEKFHEDFPEVRYHEINGKPAGLLSKGNDYMIATNVFDKLSDYLTSEKPNSNETFAEIVGLLKSKRERRFIKKEYIDAPDNFEKYKIILPESNGSSDRFDSNQIFNWSYADEQEAKENWNAEEHNPYEALPKLNMFTYQLSNMIFDTLQRGINLEDDEGATDYAFDLNEFFATNESGKFIHEDEIRKFLHALTTQEKYPFSTPELRNELKHTMWYLNRVASAKALAKLLKEEGSGFEDYEIVLAAGDGKLDDDKESKAAFNRVKDAISNYDKTITLTVGQLTVGITVPEWSAVLMLCNMQSASSYMQAAFRAQNPCIYTADDGSCYRKENAYLFDFDPARTLIIYDEFANNLIRETSDGRGSSDVREKNITRLLNFFPVLGEDSEGRMIELDAKKVLSIPRKIKCQEVIRHGFMSNFLFANITNIFGAPSIVKDIVEKLTPAHEEKAKNKNSSLDGIGNVPVNDQGKVDVPESIIIGTAQNVFGEKVYETMKSELPNIELDAISSDKEIADQIDSVMDDVKALVETHVIAPAAESYELKGSEQKKLSKEINKDIERDFAKIKQDYIQEAKVARAEFEKARQAAESDEQLLSVEADFKNKISEKLHALVESAQRTAEKTIEDKPQEVIEKIETRKAEKEKKTIEDDVRAHLRGFARTIPSFVMAYGDDNLTLANFDDYTEDDVFEEVTGISEDDFRFLRDGGDYFDETSGTTEHFDGHLFDEVVFNDSIREFLKKRRELANYFDESHEEDIFDYIPPQRTNQIFTPRWVVIKMVDELETNNPGCFDNPNKTFADLYMKSGLYITEIVKRLYRSESIRAQIPDDNERIKHILTKQVFGMAPTRIIYLIATNYILGFDNNKEIKTNNFVEADAAEAAKNGTLSSLIEKYWGNEIS